VSSLRDPLFRESLLLSDVCPADGMPVVWIAQLMGIRMQRTAGSDMFEALQHRHATARPLKIFFFGSTEAVVTDAARQLGRCPTLKCVGWICPGFGTVEEMGDDQFIEKINASGAEFLVAALGARKGQLWLQENHQRLRIPIRAHLGAVVNFLAGTVARAPCVFRRIGLEWIWRIGQEPYLWRRYWNDGRAFIRLTIRFVLPLAVRGRLLRWEVERQGGDLVVEKIEHRDSVTVRLIGYAVANQVGSAVHSFRDALATNKAMVFDLAQTRGIDARFFGLLLMVRKQLKGRGTVPQFIGLSPRLERAFRLHGLRYLLEAEHNG
jgi:N-acetylglucosaminyldiphosphoundecaprenol N-acetyl-beta-D-mannosaminyltransferase